MPADPSAALPTPLSDLRVVDLSGNLAGPYCGQILADMGADVIKVERPGAGDPARAWAPPTWGGDGTLYLASNRGKRSLALELGTPEAGKVLTRLLQRADVVIQAFRPDVARRFGLTEEVLRPRYPSVILCTISAFDPEGPHADRPGYDPLLQAHTGLMSVTGPEGGPPVRVGTSLVDLGAGMWGAIGILGALRVRDRTGEGTHVQVTLEDTGLAWGAYHLMGALATGRAPGPMGTGLGMISPYRAFPVSDGFLMIAAGNDALFRRLCAALDLPRLAADPRFATNPLRVENREALEEALEQACRSRSRDELEALLVEAGVPCAPIRDMAEVAGDPDSPGRALRSEPHPRVPGYRAVALPLRWSGERTHPLRHPPAVGEHTDEVLGESGFSRDEIDRMLERGVVAGPPET
jgi:crotonobetainyl-CoA:carnitine CoA-transferase CaiB-like acyl-CoA transferase